MEMFTKKMVIEEKLSMRDILSFYEAAKEFNGKCQLLCKKNVVEASNLPKLVSFFLTANKAQAIHIKLEGQQVKSFWKQFITKQGNLFASSYQQVAATKED